MLLASPETKTLPILIASGCMMLMGNKAETIMARLKTGSAFIFFICIGEAITGSDTGTHKLLISCAAAVATNTIIPKFNITVNKPINLARTNALKTAKNFKLSNISFSEIADIIEKTSGVLQRNEDKAQAPIESAIIKELSEHCESGGCVRFAECFGGRAMADMVTAVVAKMREGGRAESADVPESVIPFCTDADKVIRVINDTFALRASEESKARNLSISREIFINTLSALDFEPDTPTYGKAKLRVTSGAAQAAANTVSGDCCTEFTDSAGRYVAVISDGMGTGERARVDAAFCVTLLEKFLKGGIPVKNAIEIINSAMIVKSRSETFATLDLCQVDLKNGETLIIKCGAADSFVKCGRRAVKISGNGGLPLGISENAVFRETHFVLGNRDKIFMRSDGVELDDATAAKTLTIPTSPDNIARSLCADTGARDDRTVMVIGLDRV
jgi:hypothetical protein